MLVHGLWMPGVELALLSRRVAARGYTTRLFFYPSTRGSLSEHADRLGAFVREHRLERLHFVCHSLGGLVVRAFLVSREDLPPTRVVALGTPFRGSAVARTLARHRSTRWLIGRDADTILHRGVGSWPEQHPLGVIAGNRPFGFGSAVHRFTGPNDGTVAVSETRIPGTTDRIVVPSTHTGLVFSRSVADYVCEFLRYQRFSKND